MMMATGPQAPQNILATGTTNSRVGSHVPAKVPGGKLFFFQPATAEIMVCDAGDAAYAVRVEAALLEGMLNDLSDARGQLADALRAYDEAQKNQRPKHTDAIDAALKKSQVATDKLLTEFKELSEANKGKELLELLPLMHDKTGRPIFGGKKFTYVRSSKVKNHFRSYKLSGADKPEMKSFLTWQEGRGWQLDRKKLKQSFDTIKPKVSVAEQTDGLWLPESWSPSFVDGFNESMHFGSEEDKQSPDAVIAFSGEAHLLRFFGGVSLSKAVSLSADSFKKALNGSGSVGAEYKLRGSLGMELASGKLDGNFYLPWRSGLDLWIPAASTESDKQIEKLPLGHFRLRLKGELKGSCGASVLGEGGVEFKLARDGGKQGAKGSASKRTTQGVVSPKLNVKEGKLEATADAGGEITAFAGAQGGASVNGAFQWQKPESVEFADFATIEPGITLQAGAGGTACFHVTYEGDKFRIKAKLGACVGVGLKGDVLAAIDAGTIMEFALWFKNQVANAMDQNLQYFEKNAFLIFCKMCALAIVEGKNLSEYIGKNIGQLNDEMRVWVTVRHDEFVRRLQSVSDQMANSIAEVKGILLYELRGIQARMQQIQQGIGQGAQQLEMELQRAIENIQHSIHQYNELANVLQHASSDGSKIGDAEVASITTWVNSNSSISVTDLASTLKTEPTPGYRMVYNNTAAYQLNNGVNMAWQRGTLMALDDTRFA